MKFKKMLLLVFALLLCVMFVACDEAKTDDLEEITTSEETTSQEETIALEETTNLEATTSATEVHAEEAAIIDMFIKHATYYEDGYYRFRKETTQGDIVFGHTFAFNPINRTFVCSTMVSSFTPSLGICLEDYGVVVFRWGDLANGYYSGDHRLKDLSSSTVHAMIAFEYSVANSTTYKVTTNTYPQLSQTDINEYAATCFECLEQGLLYAQSVVSAYTHDLTLK